MKSALIAVAFAATLSIPAFAQDTTQTTTTGSMPAAGDASMQAPAADQSQPPAAPGGSMPATAMPDSGSMPAGSMPAGSMPAGSQGSMSSGSMSSGSMSPGATTPGAMPAGGMSSGGAAPMGMASAPPAGDTANYPVCSKTVQDRCINRGSKKMKKG